MLETLGPLDECPHVFLPGTASRARASLVEWPTRPADARCAWCGRLVDLRPWALEPGVLAEVSDPATYAVEPGG